MRLSNWIHEVLFKQSLIGTWFLSRSYLFRFHSFNPFKEYVTDLVGTMHKSPLASTHPLCMDLTFLPGISTSPPPPSPPDLVIANILFGRAPCNDHCICNFLHSLSAPAWTLKNHTLLLRTRLFLSLSNVDVSRENPIASIDNLNGDV